MQERRVGNRASHTCQGLAFRNRARPILDEPKRNLPRRPVFAPQKLDVKQTDNVIREIMIIFRRQFGHSTRKSAIRYDWNGPLELSYNDQILKE